MEIPPEILDRLVSIRVKPVPPSMRDWVTVERRDMATETRWAICCQGDRLSKSGTWDYAPLPSNRDVGWNEAHQWATFEEAWEAALAALAAKVD